MQETNEHVDRTSSDSSATGVDEVTKRGPLAALVAEFDAVDPVVRAARQVRDAGYRRWDVHSPFPIHGIDSAMGIRPTRLPWIVLAGGITGCLAGLVLAWYTNAYDYPFLISGKPLFSLPANIPVIFETTVLLAAFAAVFGMLLLNGLPKLHNPLFSSDRFIRVTNDRFVLVIGAEDEMFHEQDTRQLLESLGALAVEEVHESR